MEIGIQLIHSPIIPPRAGHHGEQVFSELWSRLMSEAPSSWCDHHRDEMLGTIIRCNDDQLSQRIATVAASFVKWLGTNCGNSFISDAERLRASHTENDGAYIMAWAYENRRATWMNHGFRSIEYILGTPEDFENGQLTFRPNLSSDDAEVVESVVTWLGSEDGREFVARCRSVLKDRLLKESVAAALSENDFSQAKRLLINC